MLQQYRFGHDRAYSARAHEFGNGGQDVDGEYEQVHHRPGTVARCRLTSLPAPLRFVGNYEFAMHTQSAKIEAGNVHLPKEADWLDTFLHELLAFPHGRHDDQVDSVSQFLKWSSQRSPFGTMMVGMVPKVFVDGDEIDFNRQADT